MAAGICEVCMHPHSLLTMPTWVKYLHELNVSKYTDFKMRNFWFFNYILCSKQSMCIFNVKRNQRAVQEIFHPSTYSWYPKIAFPAGLVGRLSSPLISLRSVCFPEPIVHRNHYLFIYSNEWFKAQPKYLHSHNPTIFIIIWF